MTWKVPNRRCPTQDQNVPQLGGCPTQSERFPMVPNSKSIKIPLWLRRCPTQNGDVPQLGRCPPSEWRRCRTQIGHFPQLWNSQPRVETSHNLEGAQLRIEISHHCFKGAKLRMKISHNFRRCPTQSCYNLEGAAPKKQEQAHKNTIKTEGIQKKIKVPACSGRMAWPPVTAAASRLAADTSAAGVVAIGAWQEESDRAILRCGNAAKHIPPWSSRVVAWIIENLKHFYS